MNGHPRWVVFDYGGVISALTAALPSLASMLGVPVAEFAAAYESERPPYDRGSSDLEYWRSVGGRLGVEVDEPLARKLTERDVEGWLVLARGVPALIDELSRHGVALALLSNASSSIAQVIRGQDWAGRFRHLLFSADFQCVKPDAAIWRILLTTIGAEAGDCLFFDDRQENVDASRAAGLRAERWQDAGHARDVLRRHGILPT
jgi:putative hydrolase of the HAD superfamily